MRRPWSGGGGSVLRITEGGGLWSGRFDFFDLILQRASRPRPNLTTRPCGTMRQLPWERERGEVNHEKITVRNKCRWRTLKPLGNTEPTRLAKGNSPGEAELSDGLASAGTRRQWRQKPGPRGWDAPLQKLSLEETSISRMRIQRYSKRDPTRLGC